MRSAWHIKINIIFSFLIRDIGFRRIISFSLPIEKNPIHGKVKKKTDTRIKANDWCLYRCRFRGSLFNERNVCVPGNESSRIVGLDQKIP